ncbi:MAG: transglutaminase-like domain-containing protein [Acidimicrobiales bacterium]
MTNLRDAEIDEPSDDPTRWLSPTEFMDFEDPRVQAFALQAVGDATDDRTKAVRIFYAVRDGLWYDPYTSERQRDAFKASHIVGLERSWCVPKSILLSASARAVGIPARLGFADVRNHLQSETLRAKMGTDLFVFHGYSELLIDGQWRKASPAFNIELSKRFDTKPLDFDGVHDALLHDYDRTGNRHMEYVNVRGSFDDFPYEAMIEAFEDVYGPGMLSDGEGAGAAGDGVFDPNG